MIRLLILTSVIILCGCCSCERPAPTVVCSEVIPATVLIEEDQPEPSPAAYLEPWDGHYTVWELPAAWKRGY